MARAIKEKTGKLLALAPGAARYDLHIPDLRDRKTKVMPVNRQTFLLYFVMSCRYC